MITKRTHFLPLSITTLLILATLFVLPLILGDSREAGICTLPRISAQDNPCLSQDATISALQVEVLQAQATNVALQSTVVALEAQAPTNGGGANTISVAGLPYEDDFSTNRGYVLTSDAQGAVRLSQGQILISANRGESKSFLIPEVTVGDNFYAQVDITFPDGYRSWVGIILCDNEMNVSCHLFYLEFGQFSDRFIGIEDQGTNLFSTAYPRIVAEGEAFTFGVEANNGSYTIYVNGQATETSNLIPYGGTLGFLVGTLYEEPRAFFDNLVVREIR